MPTIDEQMAILMQGVEYGDDQIKEVMAAELRERLAEGRPLRVYCGYDPTAPDLHLGHTVTMNKLRQFQDLGHEVTFLIGSITGLIGDPSDRDSARRQQTPEEVAQKAKSYAEQAFKVLDRERARVRYNGDWLADLRLSDVIELASQFTVQQFLAQERLAKRHERGEPIWMHEMLYALMQGYDAVTLQTDVQVGGTEQLFNLMAGRKLQEHFGQRPQVVLTMPILVGTDGHMRMSQTTGNYIGPAGGHSRLSPGQPTGERGRPPGRGGPGALQEPGPAADRPGWGPHRRRTGGRHRSDCRSGGRDRRPGREAQVCAASA